MNAGGQDAHLAEPGTYRDAVACEGESASCLPSGEFRGVRIGLYVPGQRARQKADQRRKDAQDIAEGRLQEVEARNHWLCPGGGKPAVPPETVPLLE
jgi:hypothetical protein